MAVAQNGSRWLAWRESGPPDGEPVLLIMGLGGSGRMWWRLEPHLARSHRVITIDNRGTGDSDRVRGPLTMAAMAADAVAVLDAAGVESAHVMGASMGGMVAQQVGLDHRARVRSLVLACTTAGGPAGIPNWRLLLSAAVRPLLRPTHSFAIVAPALYSERARREHPERVAEDLERRIADGTPSATLYAQMAAIARHDTRDRLGELSGLPTLVLHGTDDVLVPIERAQALADGIPGARLVDLPGCGHVLTTDGEDEVAAAVLEHLKRAAGVARAAA